jgi:hypothetical protein
VYSENPYDNRVIMKKGRVKACFAGVFQW